MAPAGADTDRGKAVSLCAEKHLNAHGRCRQVNGSGNTLPAEIMVTLETD